MLHIVCLNAGDYLGRGGEYVTRLLGPIRRHVPRDIEVQYHCITDATLPEGIEGWWNKIALFKKGMFPDGDRVLYFDLDTVITGDLSAIAAYSGPFAGLSDFYHPERFASGVMAWEAGKMDHVWEAWCAAGRPQFHPRGDQGFIEAMCPDAVRLQDEFPGQIVSFKKDCVDGVPEGARVVCFHGLPRPHVLNDLMSNWA